jgi:recombination protein RecA
VTKSGAWYTYEGEQLGQGKENAKTFLVETPELAMEIDEKIRAKVMVVPEVADDALEELMTDADDEPISLD